MRDSLQRVSTTLSGSLGATVDSTAFTLPTKGLSLHTPMMMEINYPAAASSGTAPSIIADIYHCATLAGTYTLLERVHDVQLDSATTYPKLKRRFFTTRKPYIKVRYTLANTDNVYGAVEAALSFGSSMGHREG